jgi:methylenetetrahydrofolate dehydrogenase (NADP+)/methenyltetrahydrofolate cyclohydrolase
MILDGQKVAIHMAGELDKRIKILKDGGIIPGLAIVLGGSSRPAAMYGAFLKKKAESYGISVTVIKKPDSVTEGELIKVIRSLNDNHAIHGILLLMPLPEGISSDNVVEAMDPYKDIDGLTAANRGRLAAGKPGFVPCTPRAVMAILEEYGIAVNGKKAVVLGRSNVVGLPVSLLLLQKHATVTICHSHTGDIAEISRTADILVSAVGKPGMVTADMVKRGAVVIDVGICRQNGKTVGDVETKEVAEKSSYITPVPGGVGAVTTSMMIQALVEAAEKRKNGGSHNE